LIYQNSKVLKGECMTVQFPGVVGFDKLSPQQAEDQIYNVLIPVCEKQEIYLSDYGNHNSPGSMRAIQKYQKLKADKTLFDIARIQRAFSKIDQFIEATKDYEISSYGFKHTVEKLQKEYITNGDLIVVMLMKGYSARFEDIDQLLDVNCEFTAKLKQDIEK
jgi:hypothetical protein